MTYHIKNGGGDQRYDRLFSVALKTNIKSFMIQPMSLDSNSMAALDSSLKMRGVQRLKVIDCSVMPTVLSVNANWSEVMLGERATNLILGQM